MKTSFPLLLGVALLAAAGAVAAQAPAPQAPAPSAPQPVQPRAGERTLNLKLDLDDASRRQIMRGSESTEQHRGNALPSLGEDARPLDLDLMRRSASSPFPKESASDVQSPR